MSGTDFGDPDQIIHIPARDLTGTREAKLAELDLLLAQLQMVRLVLCREPVREGGTTKGVWQEDVVLLALGMVLLGVATFVALIEFVDFCDRVQVALTILSLVLSVAAFVYLVFAMLRPERF